MSEYQYVYFAAVDGPLNDEQVEFMQRQSTRAEITRWEFSNEYNFGDFRGDAEEMLRRGFDVHLHCAHFGIRKLMFRPKIAVLDCAAKELIKEPRQASHPIDEETNESSATLPPHPHASWERGASRSEVAIRSCPLSLTQTAGERSSSVQSWLIPAPLSPNSFGERGWG